jgi:hypothetical protein
MPKHTLASSQLSLPAGTYYIRAVAPAYSGTVTTNAVKGRIRQTSGTPATLLTGPIGYLVQVTSGDPGGTWAFVEGRFTLVSTQTIELDHYTNGALMVGGLPMSSGEVEVYAEIFLWKLS